MAEPHKFTELPPGEVVYEALGKLASEVAIVRDSLTRPTQTWGEPFDEYIDKRVRLGIDLEVLEIARESFEIWDKDTRETTIRDTEEVLKSLDWGYRTGMSTARTIGEQVATRTASPKEDTEITEEMMVFGIMGVKSKRAVEMILSICSKQA